MSHVGGQLQAEFMARIRGLDLHRCLVVPVDVGKEKAMALVADHYGEVIVQPFEFALSESGFTVLASAIARSEAARSAQVVRVGSNQPAIVTGPWWPGCARAATRWSS